MKKVLTIIVWLALAIVTYLYVQEVRYTPTPQIIVTHDTITIDHPVAVHDTIIRRDVVRLPRVVISNLETTEDSSVFCGLPDSLWQEYAVEDSVDVEIPITQKVYQDSTYRAVVSGYNPSLDEITIYQRNTLIQAANKQKRWGVGVQLGVGVGKDGVSPYVGFGVHYNLFSW